ncbi:protein LURP-one-related 8-like [Panicum virgatum]|uniref:protein LURP-one-related 8-like n=1 Tax=Panicum virgatum TaxID=38727 RepID=UPI0019D56B7A|nr:protein LURP-one-related 8-like [Panicum virgatum]
MAKVHPNAVAPADPAAATTTTSSRAPQEETPAAVLLTVWRKSLLFNCHGFTVFDAKGDLAFRVDCYASARRRAEVVLMDVAGKPLLTVRRKRLISSLLAEHWVIYDGDGTASKPLLSVRRHASLRSSSSSKTLAYVTPLGSAAAEDSYVVEGSYGRRACAVRDARGDAVVAEVRRKESVGDDVFRLVADPRLGAPLAMGLVIALDEMFRGGGGSARSLLRRTWSA